MKIAIYFVNNVKCFKVKWKIRYGPKNHYCFIGATFSIINTINKLQYNKYVYFPKYNSINKYSLKK